MKSFIGFPVGVAPLQSLDELRKLRTHFPDLWAKLLDMEHQTWRTFRADYSVDQLEIRFAFEEERLAAGLPINRTREFMSALRKRLEEAGFPQITSPKTNDAWFWDDDE